MFNVGDRVKYKTQSDDRHYNSYKAGLIGTVMKIDKTFGSEEYCIVKFDTDQPCNQKLFKSLAGMENGCYSVNLEYDSYKYDPAQAGDTDEDI
jgi:hypothetical protein